MMMKMKMKMMIVDGCSDAKDGEEAEKADRAVDIK